MRLIPIAILMTMFSGAVAASIVATIKVDKVEVQPISADVGRYTLTKGSKVIVTDEIADIVSIKPLNDNDNKREGLIFKKSIEFTDVRKPPLELHIDKACSKVKSSEVSVCSVVNTYQLNCEERQEGRGFDTCVVDIEFEFQTQNLSFHMLKMITQCEATIAKRVGRSQRWYPVVERSFPPLFSTVGPLDNSHSTSLTFNFDEYEYISEVKLTRLLCTVGEPSFLRDEYN